MTDYNDLYLNDPNFHALVETGADACEAERNPNPTDAAAKRACAAWWSSFGGSDVEDEEWDGLDSTEQSYWRYIAEAVFAGRPVSSEDVNREERT